MATLSSTSTLAQIQAAYDDNASYAEDGSVAKAKVFVTACRLLLRRTPSGVTHGAGSVSMDVNQIRQELEDARQYISANGNSSTGGVQQFGFEDFRS